MNKELGSKDGTTMSRGSPKKDTFELWLMEESVLLGQNKKE